LLHIRLGLAVRVSTVFSGCGIDVWKIDYRDANSVFFDRGNRSCNGSHPKRLLSGKRRRCVAAFTRTRVALTI